MTPFNPSFGFKNVKPKDQKLPIPGLFLSVSILYRFNIHHIEASLFENQKAI